MNLNIDIAGLSLVAIAVILLIALINGWGT